MLGKTAQQYEDMIRGARRARSGPEDDEFIDRLVRRCEAKIEVLEKSGDVSRLTALVAGRVR